MSTELTNLMLGAGLNLLMALIIVRFIYYPGTQNKNYVFTFLAFNTVIYFVLEKQWGFHFEASKKISYERIELITPANSEALLADLRQRTGLPLKRVAVGRIDFTRDSAEITVYYDEPKPALAHALQDASAKRLLAQPRRATLD